MKDLMVLIGIGYVLLAVVLYIYDDIKTKKELGDWKGWFKWKK